jgi:beta-phosphoglucomutase
VITDSEVLHLRSFNQVLAEHNVNVTTKDYYRDYLGLTDVDCFRLLVNKGHLKVAEQQIEGLVKQKNRIFERLLRTEGRIIEGVRDFLGMLKQNNIPMAICSGAILTEIELTLEEAHLRSFFEIIVSAENVKRGKPNPDGFLLVLWKLNSSSRRNPISAGECVVIEDSQWGLNAAKEAGMHTVAVTNSYEAEQLAMAEKIVTKLNQLDISELQALCS